MDIVLDIQNVAQKAKTTVRDMVESRVDEVMKDGKIKVTFIIDPTKKEK